MFENGVDFKYLMLLSAANKKKEKARPGVIHVQMKVEEEEQPLLAITHGSGMSAMCSSRLPEHLLKFLFFSPTCFCKPWCCLSVLTQAVFWKADFLLDTKGLACPGAEA